MLPLATPMREPEMETILLTSSFGEIVIIVELFDVLKEFIYHYRNMQICESLSMHDK